VNLLGPGRGQHREEHTNGEQLLEHGHLLIFLAFRS
jgi:hypothetical protein